MNAESHFYEFGPFRLDAAERQLLREDRVLPLTPKAFDVLLVLVENSSRTVKKDDLMRLVWPTTCVEEVNLANNVSLLRKVLGEGSNGEHYIQTVPRRGYRFVAAVKELRNDQYDREIGAPATQGTLADRRMGRAGQARASGELNQDEQTKVRLRWWAEKRLRPQAVTAFIVIISVAAVAVYLWIRTPSSPFVELASVKSIAVLPFKPLMAGNRDELLEMGITDTLITRLGSLGAIAVRPMSSVRKYSGLDQDAAAAGREQQVDAVLDGTYQKLNDRLRLTLRLLRVLDGKMLWTDTVDKKLTDVLAVQDSITERVSGALALKLTGEQRGLLTKSYTGSSEAYDLYLRGRYFWDKRTPEGMRKAMECFQGAISNDPKYALAYVGLADTFGFAVWLGLSDDEAHAKQIAAATNAIALEPNLAEAHASMGLIKLDEEAFSEAKREFQRSIELNPNYPTAHHWYANYLRCLGRYDEGLEHIRKAKELDPNSLIINATLGGALCADGKDDEGIAQLKKTLEMDPNFRMAHVFLGNVYTKKKMYGDALLEYEKGKLKDEKGVLIVDPTPLPALAELALAPHLDAARKKRAEVLRLCERRKKQGLGFLEALEVAVAYAKLGEKDQAFALLNTYYKDEGLREPEFAAFLKSDPTLEILRSDPRFADLMRLFGLSQ
jgi:DNA-binding winged helix-turn-helix (wHTH) protein/TolB-like protein/lipoprotein NlpI